MNTINISTALNKASSVDRVASLVNEGTCEGMEGMEFSSEQLAGQYAFNAARDSGYEIDEEAIDAHLDFLRDAGGVFNTSKALAHGVAIAAATKVAKLQSAIESTDTSGFPGAWTVDQRENGDILLVWTADKKDVPEMYGDEPWTKGAGYEIIKTAGIGDYSDKDSGADSYQDKYGDDVVTQWVYFPK